MVHIYYTRLNGPLSITKLEEYKHLLPVDIRQKSDKYFFWKDQHLNILGKLLLLDIFKSFDKGRYDLNSLRYTSYNKPFVSDDFDFNISHSGDYVVCVFGRSMNIGIDIEKIRPLDLGPYKNTMSIHEWTLILNSQTPYNVFFDLWTQKESLIKADGRGMSIPLDKISIEGNLGCFESRCWHIKKIAFDLQYSMHVCSDIGIDKVNFVYRNFY